MSEALRLIGLTQDGALLPVILACAVVWMTVTVRHWREDVSKLRDDQRSMSDNLRDDHRRMGEKLERLAEDVSTLRADVAFLRGRAEQP